MTPQDIGAYIGALFVGATGALGAKHIRSKRNEEGNDPARPLGLDDARVLLREEARLTKLETRFDDFVRRMEEHDVRAAQERQDLLAAINTVGGRLERTCESLVTKVDTLFGLVYERRSEPRA